MAGIRDRVFSLVMVPIYPFYLIFNRFRRKHPLRRTNRSYVDWATTATPSCRTVGLLLSLMYWEVTPVAVWLLTQ